MAEPAWRAHQRRTQALQKARDEALEKVENQRARLEKLERKYASVKGNLRGMVRERNILRDALWDIRNMPFRSDKPHTVFDAAGRAYEALEAARQPGQDDDQ